MDEQPARTSGNGPSRLIADRYRLDSPLGTGGMAQVWSATDVVLSRPVAVKILHRHLADDPDFVRRFRREAVAAARLVHPSIVAVYDTISTPECEAIVMELVDGETLRELLDRDGTLPEDRARALGRELAGALDCAHRNGIVHRDIKPANILVTSDGSARLADFGIAKAEEDPDLTVAGTLVGTAAYLAPEQVGGGRVDQRSDLYSLSTVLYEAVAGAPPFRGDTPAATAIARLHQTPDPLASRVDGLSRSFTGAVMRNLSREPEQRFQSALDFGAALADDRARRSRSSTPAAPRPGATPPPTTSATTKRRPARSGRSVVGRVVVAVLCLAPVGLVAALVWPSDDDTTTTSDDPTTTTVPVGITAAAAYDPYGDTREENNDQAPAAVDGDPATSWSTEGYNAQDFGTKDGVGLVVRLSEAANVNAVTISGSIGWKGRLYITRDDPGAAPEPPTTGGFEIDAATSPVTVATPDERGTFALIWITDLGPSEGRHRVEISEVTVEAGAISGG